MYRINEDATENYSGMNRKELEDELRKSKNILNMFSNIVFGGIARMNPETMEILTATKGYYRMTGYTKEESHQPPFSDCGLNLVLPEDICQVKNIVRRLNEGEQAIRADYRIRKKDGTIAWNAAFTSGLEENEEGRYIDVFFLDITQEKNTEMQLKSLLNNMSSGLVRLKLTDGMDVCYANQEFYRQIGYSPEEFAAGSAKNDYLQIIHQDDRDRIYQMAREFVKTEETGQFINFRIVSKEGVIRWIRAYGSRLYEELQGENILQCILTDITKEREQERQNRLNEERFRIISEQTCDVVFDWDIGADSIHYSPVFKKMFGFPPPPSISTKELLEGELFYQEDKPVIKKMIQDMCAALPYVESRARMKAADGSYFWTLHRATTIYDEDCRSIRIVGVISDVNDFMKSTIEFQHQAAHDLLTGLLNRMAGRRLIEQELEKKGGKKGRVFVQFDIDRFKQINDFMGHAAGDLALQKIAMQMREAFKNEEILIRMGGDEFAVFINNVLSQDSVVKKMYQFLQTVYCDFKFGEKIYPLSISIGVAIYPQDGKTFQELYEHADIALYQAKGLGGNHCEFFSLKVSENKTRHSF